MTQSKKMLRETELRTRSTVELPGSRSHIALNAGTVVQSEVNVVQKILLQILILTHFVKTENRKQNDVTRNILGRTELPASWTKQDGNVRTA